MRWGPRRRGFSLGVRPRPKGAADPVAEAEDVISALSPIGWWKFDEGTGTTVENAANPGTYDLTFGGGAAAPTWTAEGLSFDGGDTLSSSGDIITGSAARTLIFVGKPGATNNQIGVEFTGDPVATSGERWALKTTGGPPATSMRWEIQGAGAALTNLVQTAGQWSFFAMTQDGGSDVGGTAYLDAASEAFSNAATVSTDGPLQFGKDGTTIAVCEFAYGLLFDSELSGANIAALRTALTTIMDARGVTLP